jgi:hypothetical protein
VHGTLVFLHTLVGFPPARNDWAALRWCIDECILDAGADDRWVRSGGGQQRQSGAGRLGEPPTPTVARAAREAGLAAVSPSALKRRTCLAG